MNEEIYINSRFCTRNHIGYGYSLSSNANKAGTGSASATLRKEGETFECKRRKNNRNHAGT